MLALASAGALAAPRATNAAFTDPALHAEELTLQPRSETRTVPTAVALGEASSSVQPTDLHKETPVPDSFNRTRVVKFVVLSQARSGSTWLNTMLNAHPGVLAYGEYLSKYAGIHAYVNDGWDCQPMRRLARLESVSALKECTEWHYDKKRAWIRAAERGTVALGFKWFNNEGGWDLDWAAHQGDNKCPDAICGTCTEPSQFKDYLRDRKVKLVLLEREASLPHFVSAMKLQHNKSHYACADRACTDELAKQKINVSTSQMLQWLKNTEHYWSNMRRFARDVGVEQRVVTYDTLARDPQSVVADLFRFLSLEPIAVNTTQTVKMGAAVMRDSLENADEVAVALRGTRYEGQVDRVWYR